MEEEEEDAGADEGCYSSKVRGQQLNWREILFMYVSFVSLQCKSNGIFQTERWDLLITGCRGEGRMDFSILD